MQNDEITLAWVVLTECGSWRWDERSTWSPKKKELVARYLAESAVIGAQHDDYRLPIAYASAAQVRALVGEGAAAYIRSAGLRLKRAKWPYKPSAAPVTASVTRLLGNLTSTLTIKST